MKRLLSICKIPLLLPVFFLIPFHSSIAQVLQLPDLVEPGSQVVTLGPSIAIEDNQNDIGILVSAARGLGERLDVRFKFILLEESYYYGGDIELLLKSESPAVSVTAGGHYVDDPAVDATIKAAFPLIGIFDVYIGADTDLILDDNPDLPIWAFAGFNLNLTDQIDILVEFNFGTVEVAPHIMAAGIAVNL